MKFLDLDGLNTLKSYIKKTYADKAKLDGLKLYGESFDDTLAGTKGLRLGIEGCSNDTVSIPIVKPGDASTYGLMSGADKAKLDSLSDGGGSTVTDPTAFSKIMRFEEVVTDDVTITEGSMTDSDGVIVYLETKKIFAFRSSGGQYYNNGSAFLTGNYPCIWVNNVDLNVMPLAFEPGYKASPNGIYVDKNYKMYVGGASTSTKTGITFCNSLNVINVTNIATNEINVAETE